MNRPSLLPLPAIVLNMLLGSERASMLTKGQRVVPKKTLDLGFQYLYPQINEACKQLVTRPKSI